VIDPERIVLVPTCESCREHYDALFDEWKVGTLRLRHSSFSVWFLDFAGEVLCHERVASDGNLDHDAREQLLLRARRLFAARLDRAPAFQVGQRVRYELRLPGPIVAS
jgi:hypothetical protein